VINEDKSTAAPWWILLLFYFLYFGAMVALFRFLFLSTGFPVSITISVLGFFVFPAAVATYVRIKIRARYWWPRSRRYRVMAIILIFAWISIFKILDYRIIRGSEYYHVFKRDYPEFAASSLYFSVAAGQEKVCFNSSGKNRNPPIACYPRPLLWGE